MTIRTNINKSINVNSKTHNSTQRRTQIRDFDQILNFCRLLYTTPPSLVGAKFGIRGRPMAYCTMPNFTLIGIQYMCTVAFGMCWGTVMLKRLDNMPANAAAGCCLVLRF